MTQSAAKASMAITVDEHHVPGAWGGAAYRGEGSLDISHQRAPTRLRHGWLLQQIRDGRDLTNRGKGGM